jgi:hypothetical protein
MMRAMPGLPPAFTAPVGDSISPQGSSGTKVLADYAAMSPDQTKQSSDVPQPASAEAEKALGQPLPREIGGREGPEPTRFGDWEKSGRCIDF